MIKPIKEIRPGDTPEITYLTYLIGISETMDPGEKFFNKIILILDFVGTLFYNFFP